MNFTTQRLMVRDWAPDLTGPGRAALEDGMAALLTPAVLAPLPPGVQSLDAGVSGWIDRQAGLAQVLTIRLRASDALVGLAMLMRGDAGAVHLGYLLAEAHWRQGYASEVVTALVAQFSAQAPVTLRAGVARDNPASARVLSKAGFVADRADPTDEVLHFSRVL